MFTLLQYLQTLQFPHGLVRRLEGLRLCLNEEGNPIYHVGNSAIVFKCDLNGRTIRLKCYTRPMREHLKCIYGDCLWREELYIYSSNRTGRWVDVVVEDWVEGEPLDGVIERAAARGDSTLLMQLSRRFDALARRLLMDDWAHGDLKPENILVDREGELTLIDFDGAYLPELAHLGAHELGTPAYRHPARTQEHYDALLDHFPSALISVQLRALALDPTLMVRYPASEGYIFDAQEAHSGSAALEEVEELFARACQPLHYRLVQQLRTSDHRLYGLEELYGGDVPLRDHTSAYELFIERGYVGYRYQNRVCIPALFDEGFDFEEGWAAVRLGRWWHYIDYRGRSVFTPPCCQGLKSLHYGLARYVVDGRWYAHRVK